MSSNPDKLQPGDTVGFWLKHKHHFGTVVRVKKDLVTVTYGNGKRVLPASQLRKREAPCPPSTGPAPPSSSTT